MSLHVLISTRMMFGPTLKLSNATTLDPAIGCTRGHLAKTSMNRARIVCRESKPIRAVLERYTFKSNALAVNFSLAAHPRFNCPITISRSTPKEKNRRLSDFSLPVVDEEGLRGVSI
jgi:hypothetical protein